MHPRKSAPEPWAADCLSPWLCRVILQMGMTWLEPPGIRGAVPGGSGTAQPALGGERVHQVCLEAGFSPPGRGACLQPVPVYGGLPSPANQDRPMSLVGEGAGALQKILEGAGERSGASCPRGRAGRSLSKVNLGGDGSAGAPSCAVPFHDRPRPGLGSQEGPAHTSATGTAGHQHGRQPQASPHPSRGGSWQAAQPTR